jgi:glycolate oxidase iron-sulfur subunit
VSNNDVAAISHQIDRCNKCGSCRDVCPVFREMGAEPWVARARVQLLNAVLEGKANFSDRFTEIMNACLLCKACVANCPNSGWPFLPDV